MPNGYLHRYFLNNANKRLHKWVHYFDIYERHLERFRDARVVMLEIGVFGGGSLEMWKEYLGPDATIVGLDIDPECAKHARDGIDVFIGSQDDPLIIHEIVRKYPQIDIVLDDGSHRMDHTVRTFELAYHRISANGVYIVEDTHTCYWPDYGGGLGRDGTFMELAKAKMDEINAVHSKGALAVSDFTRTTNSITCYDSVVVFERRPQGHRQAPITGPMDPDSA